MNHRYYSYLSGWEWHVLQHTTPKDMISICPEASDWLLQLDEHANNSIQISNPDGISTIVHGMINIQLSEHKDDIHPLYFWMTASKLITIHKENSIPFRLQSINFHASYEQSTSAPEAFCTMLANLLEQLHINLDHFQTTLGELELKVSNHNRKDLLDDIIEQRYNLLHYSHLYLPYRECEGILREAFNDELTDKKSYIRLQHRLERLNTLLKHYAVEIDTLLSVDDAISSMRGNEIIRTLTIFTVLCLPATILGSVWGSNFAWLPFKESQYGFLYLVATIFIITSFLSLLLWKKGWTGDIITNSKAKHKSVQKKAISTSSSVNDNATITMQHVKDEQYQLPPRHSRGQKKRTNEKAKADEASYIELPTRSKRRK